MAAEKPTAKIRRNFFALICRTAAAKKFLFFIFLIIGTRYYNHKKLLDTILLYISSVNKKRPKTYGRFRLSKIFAIKMGCLVLFA